MIKVRSDLGDINIEIRRRKFSWIGHTLGKSPEEIRNYAFVTTCKEVENVKGLETPGGC